MQKKKKMTETYLFLIYIFKIFLLVQVILKRRGVCEHFTAFLLDLFDLYDEYDQQQN